VAPLVCDARRAAALRDARDRRRDALLACRASALFDTVLRRSRFNARLVAAERRPDGRLRLCAPARLAYFALCFVFALAVEGGGDSLTPARRAFDRPIAIACFVDRAPCLPSRT